MKGEITGLASAITIKESPFYKNEIIKPFIDAFLLKPNLVNEDPRCVLLNQYLFGEYKLEQLKKFPTYTLQTVDVFIGYRFLSRKYRPFFLTLSKHDNNEFEITGFSTLMENDLMEKPYYQVFKILPTFTNWNFKLSISGHSEPNYSKIYKIQSLFESLKKISEKTKIKNEKLLQKMKQ